MTCARAFGACVDMRDLPIDAPIPVFEPKPYYANQIEAAKRDIARFESMTDGEANGLALEVYLSAVELNAKRRAEFEDLKAKYEKMLADVDAWMPPTSEHIEMKNFMRQQIVDSIKFDCSIDWIADPEKKTGAQYREEMLTKSRENLEYATREHEKEIERTQQRNNWIAALRESLG